eukprot:320711-Amphidinium_carterae.1
MLAILTYVDLPENAIKGTRRTNFRMILAQTVSPTTQVRRVCTMQATREHKQQVAQTVLPQTKYSLARAKRFEPKWLRIPGFTDSGVFPFLKF